MGGVSQIGRRTAGLGVIVIFALAVSVAVGVGASSARRLAHPAAACPLAGQCALNPSTNCPLGGPSGQVAPAPIQVSPPRKCVTVPTTLFWVTATPPGGGCNQVLFVQVKLQPGITQYESVVYSAIGEGTRWWADPSTPQDQTGAATHAGQTYTYGAVSYTVPAGYLAWDVGGGGGGSCNTTIAPPAEYGAAGWGVTATAASGHGGSGRGAISIHGPTHNAFHVFFNQFVTGHASGAANYVVSFEQTPPAGGCARTYLGERSRAGTYRWPTGTGPVRGHFGLVARFYSRNHSRHLICSYLINIASGHTYAHAQHGWSNA